MTDDLLAQIGRLCAADKAQCGIYAHKLQRFAPDLVTHILAREAGRKASEPMPAFADLTALECTIFDNWLATGGKRPKRGQAGRRAQRFRAVIKAWTIPAEKIDFRNPKQCSRYEVLLYDENELGDKACQHLRHGRSNAAETINELITGGIARDRLTGVLMAKPFGEGTVYHPNHAFVIDADLTDPSAHLIDVVNANKIDLPPFDSKDAAGRPLIGNAQIQSRYASLRRLKAWTSKRQGSIPINSLNRFS